jgi:transposase
LQDVLARLDKTYQAFFRRIQRGEKAGFPRFKGKNRYHSFTYKEYGNGARLDNGFLVLSKIGRISVHWSRPIEGTPKTVTISHEADGWYVAISCTDVSLHPLPSTEQEMAIDLGLESFATLANGEAICALAAIARPRRICVAASAGWRDARRVVTADAKRWSYSPRRINISAISDLTFTARRRWRLYV